MGETLLLSEWAWLMGVGVAAGALGLSHGLAGRWVEVTAVVALALLWLVGRRCGWGWRADLGLVGFTVAAAPGLGRKPDDIWMLVGAVAALCAWDLDHFARRLRHAAWDRVSAQRRETMERAHLGHLLPVAAVGLLLAMAALRVEVHLTFFMALLLALLALIGLSWAIGLLRRAGD